MGLDINLHRCDDLQTEIDLQDQADAFNKTLWDGRGYANTSESDKESIRAATKAEYARLGLDQFGCSTKIESVLLNSALYPQHLFKVGYLRSSYNSDGINGVMERVGCPTLYDIFRPTGDYYFSPDWEDALTRVESAINAYSLVLQDPFSSFAVMEVRNPIFDGVDSPKKALDLFKEQMQTYNTHKETNPNSLSSYRNREGEFYLEGRRVFGFIPNSGWGKGFHVIVGKEAVEKPEDDWYFQALLITKETIGYVLSRPVQEQKNYFLAWSG